MKNLTESLMALFSKHSTVLKAKGVKVTFSEEQKMTSAILADGTEIKTPAETWGEGVDVVGADGQPLATGDYTLQDGSILSVTDGKVVKISPAGQDEMSAEEVAEALEIVAAEQQATIEAMSEEKRTLEAEVAEKETQLQTMSKQVEDLKKEVAKLAKLPATFSTKHERQDKNDDAPKTRGQQLREQHEQKKVIFGVKK